MHKTTNLSDYSLLAFFCTLFILIVAFFPDAPKKIEPPKQEEINNPIKVELSVDGHVSWQELPQGTIHVIFQDGKLVGVKSIPVPEADPFCDNFVAHQ